MATRELAWIDRLVGKLVQEFTGDCESGSPVLLDTDYNAILLELSADEWTKLFSCILTGGDLVYPDESHQILWSFLKGVECAMSFCQKMIECIENDADTRNALIDAGVIKIGAIFTVANMVAPYGCLICDGSEYARVDYPLLYDALSDVFHIDADTFNVPDLQNRFIYGVAYDADDVGGVGGEENHTLIVSEIPAHEHDYLGAGSPQANKAGSGSENAVQFRNTQTTASEGGGNPHNNMPPYMTLNYVIQAF